MLRGVGKRLGAGDRVLKAKGAEENREERKRERVGEVRRDR